MKDLLRRLFQNDYRIVGVDAKVVLGPADAPAGRAGHAGCRDAAWVVFVGARARTGAWRHAVSALRPPAPLSVQRRRWEPEGGMAMLTGSSEWFRWARGLLGCRKWQRRIGRRQCPLLAGASIAGCGGACPAAACPTARRGTAPAQPAPRSAPASLLLLPLLQP